MTSAGSQRLKIVYFAWVRERIGRAGEDVELPDGIVTIADLVAWLIARGPEYAAAFARPEVIRAAMDHAHRVGDLAGAQRVERLAARLAAEA
jgi:molybdopterin synthase sulfur carrier subunit